MIEVLLFPSIVILLLTQFLLNKIQQFELFQYYQNLLQSTVILLYKINFTAIRKMFLLNEYEIDFNTNIASIQNLLRSTLYFYYDFLQIERDN